MSQEQDRLSELMKSVHAAPEDDGPRLAVADWLQAQGRTHRATFIRAQLAFARATADGDQEARDAAFSEWRALLDAGAEQFVDAPHDCLKLETGYPFQSFERGFATDVTVTNANLFVRSAERLLATATIRSLRFPGGIQARQLSRLAALPGADRFIRIQLSTQQGPYRNVPLDLFEGETEDEFPSLKELGIAYTCLFGDHMAKLAGSPRFSAARSFRFSRCGIQPADLRVLMASRPVESLYFESCPIDEDAMAVIAELGGSLEELSFLHAEVRGKALKLLTRGGPYPHLQRLTSWFNPLGKAGLTALGKCKAMPALTHLDVRGAKLKPGALDALAKGPLAKTLVSLNVQQNDDLGDEGVLGLATSGEADAFGSLRSLTVGHCGVGLSGYDALVSRFGEVVHGVRVAELRAEAEASPEPVQSSPLVSAGADSVTIADPNLRLLVGASLRQAGELPAFRVEPFFEQVLGRRFDDGAESCYRVNTRVLDHLLDIALPPGLAAMVTELRWEPDAFMDVWTYWDGECDTFDIKSLEGIAALEGLKVLSLRGGNGVRNWQPLTSVAATLTELDLEGGVGPGGAILASLPLLERVRFAHCQHGLSDADVSALQARGVAVEL